MIPGLEMKKTQIENEISSLEAKIEAATQELNDFPNQIAELEAKLPKLIESLRVLRSQIYIYESRLRGAYQAGNTANERVTAARQNLDAANQRYIQEDKIIQEATQNIEVARVEKEKADQAVEDFLREGAEILPFAAAPGESGFEPIGGGEYSIKSWEEYVEVAYGKGVKPLFIGDLKSLYSFKIKEEENIQKEDETCGAENQKSVSGYILQVFVDGLVVINDEGIQFRINYSQCTKALANVKEYNLTPGDVIVLKGVKHQEKNEITATQMTCIRRWFKINLF